MCIHGCLIVLAATIRLLLPNNNSMCFLVVNRDIARSLTWLFLLVGRGLNKQR